MKVYDNVIVGRYMNDLQVNDHAQISGPFGNLHYYGDGNFLFSNPKRDYKAKHCFLCCGGTGITPVFQILQYLKLHPNDPMEIIVLYANHTIDDILLYDECDWFNKHDSRVQFHWTVSKLETYDDWDGFTGRINEDMFNDVFMKKKKCLKSCVAGYCGPPEFECKCKDIFKKIGFSSKQNLFRW